MFYFNYISYTFTEIIGIALLLSIVILLTLTIYSKLTGTNIKVISKVLKRFNRNKLKNLIGMIFAIILVPWYTYHNISFIIDFPSVVTSSYSHITITVKSSNFINSKSGDYTEITSTSDTYTYYGRDSVYANEIINIEYLPNTHIIKSIHWLKRLY